MVVEQYNMDGALTDALSAVGNAATGLGTQRDKSQAAAVNAGVYRLAKNELEALFQNDRLIEKVISAYPKDSAKKWGEWSLESGDPQAIAKYARNLRLKNCFVEAGILGRLYGDGFIVMGIDDGQPATEPVDESKISSIRWIQALSRYSLQPDITSNTEDPEHFLLVLGDRRIPGDDESIRERRVHKSRVLRFPGKWLPYEILRLNGGYHDSVLQAMFNAFAQFSGGQGASSAMLQDYSVFVYKLKGLRNTLEASGAVTSGVVDQQKSPTDKLLTRFRAIQMGMSIIKGLMIDADTEDASFMQRNYAGVPEIIEGLKRALIAAADMPESRLFGSSNQGAFSEAGKSDRYEWASNVASYQSVQWSEHIEHITRLMLLAKDGPTRGALPDFSFNWHSILELTDLERAELRFKNAQSDSLYISKEVLRAEEVRESRFGGGGYGEEITLKDKATRTDANIIQLRQDVADGLVPKSVYWQAIGLDAAQVLEMEQQERDRQISKPSGRFW